MALRGSAATEAIAASRRETSQHVIARERSDRSNLTYGVLRLLRQRAPRNDIKERLNEKESIMKRKLQRNLIAVLLVGLAAMLASLAIPAYGAWIVMAGLASELALIVENLRLSTGS